MMLRISDRTLRRWLRTGKPRRIDGRLDDSDVAARLDAMTALTDQQIESLAAALHPPAGLNDRVVDRVTRRTDSEAIGALIDLLGLGWHTASAVLDPVEQETVRPQDQP